MSGSTNETKRRAKVETTKRKRFSYHHPATAATINNDIDDMIERE